MFESTSCQKLRDELKAIRTGLEEVIELLSPEGGAAADKQQQARASLDFFDQITRPDEVQEDQDLFRRVLALITGLGYASTMVLQHKLEVNYRQASSIIAELERAGLIGPAHGFRPHAVLPPAYDIFDRIGGELVDQNR